MTIEKQLDGTQIIFIHGLSAKPREATLLAEWRRALLASVRADNPELAAAMQSRKELFRMAYWANAVPDHIEDTSAITGRMRKATDRVIRIRRSMGKRLHISSKGWLGAQIKRFGTSLINALATALTVKPEVIEAHMREVRLYHLDQYIADRIRDPLERELREAWDAGLSVIVAAHSMGSFIAYDVLWRFSHRSEAHYRRYRKCAVELLITMGSPLGDAALRKFMLIDRWKQAPRARTKTERRRFFPTNIRRWHNYSAYGDLVCHDATLADDFFRGLCENVGGYGKDDLRDYLKLFNPFVDPSGQQNPHKSYGYLIQPKLSQKLRQFFGAA